jgi:hypothetical protein
MFLIPFLKNKKCKESRQIKSSLLCSVGYNQGAEELDICFHDGRIYRFFEVPQAVYRDFITSASKGRFYFRNIREAYRLRRMG